MTTTRYGSPLIKRSRGKEKKMEKRGGREREREGGDSSYVFPRSPEPLFLRPLSDLCVPVASTRLVAGPGLACTTTQRLTNSILTLWQR